MNKEIVKNLHLVKSDLEKQREELTRKAEIVTKDIESIERLIQRYEGQMPLGIEAEFTVPDKRFAKIPLKKAALMILQGGSSRGMKVADIRESLLAGGYETTAQSNRNRSAAIFAVLHDLVKEDRAVKLEPGLYKAKEINKIDLVDDQN